MSLQDRLILFFFVTSVGSALSSIASFLSIENYFQSLIFIGFALSARTLASAMFSYYANTVIQKIGIKSSLLASQIFGIFSLMVLFLGFHFDSFNITITGLIFSGLPSTFAAIVISILLKMSSENAMHFRKYSGRRELVFGLAMLTASILAPLLLYKFSLNFILLIDVISYLFGLGLLLDLNVTFKDPEEESKLSPLRKLIISSKNAQSYLLKTSASLLLAGLLPLLASSGKISFTTNMPLLMREWLWSIEDVTAISASLIYLFFVVLRKQKVFEILVMLNGIWLIIPLFFTQTYSIILSALIICLLTDFAGQKFRDDLVISAGNNVGLTKSYSALAQFQRNLIFSLSPIVLSFLLSYTSSIISVITLVLIQLTLYLIYKLSSLEPMMLSKNTSVN